MKIEEAYLRFIQSVNQNIGNDNISADRGRFILLLNSAFSKLVEYTLEKKNEDDIRQVQRLLVKDKKLKYKSKKLNHQDFILPDNIFEFTNIQAFAESGSCKKAKIYLHEVKNEDVEEYLSDEAQKPSFKYRETFYTIGGDTVSIYVDDFNIKSSYITYYRKPKEVDIKGYIKENGKTSVSIDPEFDDYFVLKAIEIAVKDFFANEGYYDRYQLDVRETNSKL